jgi:hypothetical protein
MTDDVTIYQTDPDATIERLAELDSNLCPKGRLLWRPLPVNQEPRCLWMAARRLPTRSIQPLSWCRSSKRALGN